MTGLVFRRSKTGSIDIRDLTSGFNFDGNTDDSTAFLNAIANAPDNARILLPSLPLYTSVKINIPATKSLHFIASPGFSWIRKSPIVQLEVDSALDINNKQAVSAISVVSGPAFDGASNSLQTDISVADSTQFNIGDIVKLVAEDAIPNQVPFDVGNTKVARMGRILTVTGKNIGGANTVRVAGEIIDRALFTTGRFLIKLDTTKKFSWTGKTILDASGTWIGVNDVDAFTIKSRYIPEISNFEILVGSGKGIQLVGCLLPKVENIIAKDMQNNSSVVGYGVIDTACQNATIKNCISRGNMRHVADSQVFQSSAASFNYDYYGNSRNTLFEEISDFGSGHSPVSPHVEAKGQTIKGVRSVMGVAGASALGAGVSVRGADSLVDGFYIQGRAAGIEVNDQVSNQCLRNKILNGTILDTATAGFISSLLNTGLNTGSTVDKTIVENVTHSFSRGVSISLCSGQNYLFKNWMAYLTGANTNTTLGFVQPSGNNVNAEIVDSVFDATAYTGGSSVYAVCETAVRTSQKLTFKRCKFVGTFAALVNAATPVGTGANISMYEFIDCEFNAQTVPVLNQGTARVIVRYTGSRGTGRPPSGSLISPSHFNNAAASALNTGGVVCYHPFDLDELTRFQAIQVDLSTAQAGAECRVAIYDNSSTGRPGRLLLDAGAISLASSIGKLSATIDWTTPYKGRFWVQVQVKAANPQVTMSRLSSVLPNHIFGNETQWTTAATNGLRAYVSTETYGPAAAIPTNIVATNGSDTPIAWLKTF